MSGSPAGPLLTLVLPLRADAGLALAGLGAFAARVAIDYTALSTRLRRAGDPGRGPAVLAAAVDGLAALTTWFALSPWPEWQPLAVLGPVVVGLARLTARQPDTMLAVPAADRARAEQAALALPPRPARKRPVHRALLQSA